MANTIPSIACLGVIGRNRQQTGNTPDNMIMLITTSEAHIQNNPLHITIFPSYDTSTQTYAPIRTPLQFSLLLSGTLDIFEARSRHLTNPGSSGGSGGGSMLLSGDFGLLHAVDDRLAAYGFETNTGVKFVAVVDMRGRATAAAAATVSSPSASAAGGRGLPSSSSSSFSGGVGLRDSELKPVFRAMQTAYVRLLQNPFYDPDETTTVPAGAGVGARRITSRKFGDEMRRVGEVWAPGVANV
ncbi:Longin-like domain-containing protein [Nemania sp. NC0429]|nr:Longin-like domain-containing protein [Nemania sp. NC0429]